MLQNVFQLKADLKKKSTFVATPEIVQNDNVRFEIEVTDNGKSLALDNVQTVSLAHSTKGETVVTSGEIEGNKVIFNLGTLETKYVGQVNATVQLYDVEGRISTIKFPYYVVADPTGKDYVPSEKEQTLIEVVMAEAQAKIDELSQVDVVDLKAKQDEFTAQLAKTENKLELDGWELSNKKRKKQALLTIHDDDGRAEVLTKLLPLSQKYNVPFNLGIIAQNIVNPLSGRLTIEDMLMLQNEYGYEMMSHTYTHAHLGDLTEAEQEYEIRHSKEIMEENGLKVHGMSFPFRSTNDKTIDIVRKYYRYAKSGGNGLNSSPLQTYGLKQHPFGSYIVDDPNAPHPAGSLEHYKWLIDQAVEKEEWLIFGFHIAETDDTQIGYLDSIIEYALSLGVDIVTINEGLNRVGNVLDVGKYNDSDLSIPHFSLGYDGKISSSEMQNVVVRQDGFNGLNPPSDFEPRKIYHTRMSLSEAQGVPGGAGELITYTVYSNEGDLSTRYQRFRDNGSIDFWIRSQISEDEWSEWVQESASVKLPDNTMFNDTPREAFPKNKVSYVRVHNSIASGFPKNQGGILITNNIVPVVGYIYQEYYIASGGGVYRRFATSNGWGDWLNADPIDNFVSADTITAEMAGNTFPTGKITYCEITPNGKGNFPSTGLLATNRLSNSHSRIFQQLEATETWDIYRRWWNAAQVQWSEWKKATFV